MNPSLSSINTNTNMSINSPIIIKKPIRVNRSTLKNKNNPTILIIQYIFLIYQIYLLLSQSNSNNQQQYHHLRIAFYSIFFLLNQSLMITQKILFISDPLQIGIIFNTIKHITILLHANMIYLMFTIILQLKSIAFLVLFHYTLNFWINKQYTASVKIHSQVGIYKPNKLSIVNSVILYTFTKTLYGDVSISDISLIFLILFGINLFLASQIKKISLITESAYFGWSSHERKQGITYHYDRKWGLKTIMLIVCGILVFQNLLLIFDFIRNQIFWATVHTLLIGCISFYLYKSNVRL